MADTAALDSLIKAIERNTAADKESINQLKELFDPRSGFFRAKRAQEKKEYKAVETQVDIIKRSSSNMVAMNDTIAKAQAYQELNMKVTKKQRSQIISDAKQAMKTSATMDKAQKTRIKRVLGEIRVGRNLENNLHKLSAEVSDAAKIETELLDKKVKTAAKQSLFYNRMNELGQGTKKLKDNFFKLSTASGLLIAGTMKSYDLIEETARTQAPVIGMLTGEFSDFVEQYGVSQKDFLNIFDQNTRSIMGASSAMTSMEDAGKGFISSYSSMHDELRELTGNNKDAMELAAEGFSTLGLSGVKMSFEEMAEQMTGQNGIAKSMRFLARSSNKSSKEIGQMTSNMMQDESMRLQLLGLSEKERKNRVRLLLQQTEQMRANGLSIERSMEFQKTLARINQSQDPKSFMKMIGKTMAVAGAAGVDSSSIQRYREEMMKAPAQQDAGFLSEFATKLDTALGKQLGSGQTGTRMLGMQLKSILPSQTQEMITAGSTAADKQAVLTEEQTRILKEQTSLIEKGALGFIEWTKDWYEKGKAVFGSAEASYIGGIGSAIGSVITFAAELGLAKIGLSALGMSFSSLTAPIAGAVTGLGGFLSSLVFTGTAAIAAVGAVASSVAGAAGYAVGTGIDKLWAWADQESHIVMQDMVGGTINQMLETGFLDTFKRAGDYWTDEISSWFGDNSDQSAKEKERNKIEVENAEKMVAAIKEQTEAIEAGNMDRVAASKETIRKLDEQITTQKESDEKAMEQQKTKQRQAYFVVP